MIKNDDKLIWGALINERRNPDADTYDAEGELPGPIAELDPNIEEEEGGCPNLDKLIGLASALPEDAEGTEIFSRVSSIHSSYCFCIYKSYRLRWLG